jgi:hypothetical protein
MRLDEARRLMGLSGDLERKPPTSSRSEKTPFLRRIPQVKQYLEYI